MFESVFVIDFDPEMVLQQQTLYNIQNVSRELEFIATNVCLILLICAANNPLSSISQYYKLPEVVIGGYDLVRDEEGEPVPLQLHLRQYREATLNASEARFTLDGHVDELDCKYIHLPLLLHILSD